MRCSYLSDPTRLKYFEDNPYVHNIRLIRILGGSSRDLFPFIVEQQEKMTGIDAMQRIQILEIIELTSNHES